MTNYHDGASANPLDAIVAMFLPACAPTSAPEPAQFIPRRRQGMHQFLWPWDHRAGMDAEHLVEKYGVHVADGSRVIPKQYGDVVGFSVPEHQAQWAEYILLRGGYALTTPLVNPAHRRLLEKAQAAGASRPPGGSKRIKRHGIVDRLWHWTDEIIGIGQSGRNRMLPVEQSWRPARSYAPPHQPSWWERLFGSLFGGGDKPARKERY